jgi:hypothetical protein
MRKPLASDTVQLPFNKQGFEQSLAGQAVKNHYHCRPIFNIRPPAHWFVLATKVATTHRHFLWKLISVVSKLMTKLMIH